jgi:hypothetical protein
MKSVLMAVILCSLCFSVGEGLRLTPFPVSNLLQVEDSNGLAVAKNAGGVTRTYGPLDVPSKVQKRTKRQTTDFGSQPRVEIFRDISLVSHRVEELSVQLGSSQFITRPSGRAPPFLS